MSVANPYSQYMENQFNTATPGKLIVLAYDGAIRFLKTAAEKMQEHKLDEQSANITKAQKVILELISSLDAGPDPELAANLEGLYAYAFDKLTHANLRNDLQALEEVIGMLTEMRSVWAQAELMIRSGNTSSEALAA